MSAQTGSELAIATSATTDTTVAVIDTTVVSSVALQLIVCDFYEQYFTLTEERNENYHMARLIQQHKEKTHVNKRTFVENDRYVARCLLQKTLTVKEAVAQLDVNESSKRLYVWYISGDLSDMSMQMKPVLKQIDAAIPLHSRIVEHMSLLDLDRRCFENNYQCDFSEVFVKVLVKFLNHIALEPLLIAGVILNPFICSAHCWYYKFCIVTFLKKEMLFKNKMSLIKIINKFVEYNSKENAVVNYHEHLFFDKIVNIYIEFCKMYRSEFAEHKKFVMKTLYNIMIKNHVHCRSTDNELLKTIKDFAKSCKEVFTTNYQFFEPLFLHQLSDNCTNQLFSLMCVYDFFRLNDVVVYILSQNVLKKNRKCILINF
ncbi:ac11 [Lambdina fiscellaria nucleopolyhedrovirus]|uniref:Ac11 n=1 Tax=Lambdina fiscellaria nucleopolyhedrovirus TaxID=1642929 RepID=A0A0E3Z7C6_9ABAC|nr:ac11 [Lambdina fiscellaria nucleopolyhedrovirus]AKC91643.1 ac11 [Lambdina fiscellaria nucleopolyhedrovirus]